MRGAVSSGGVLPPQRQLPGDPRPRGRANRHRPADQVAESRIRDWLIGVQSPPAMVCEAYGGRTVTHGEGG